MGDQDCDEGDTCNLDTCDNGLCLSTPDCASCSKTKVEVDITIDNYGDETSYDIKDAYGDGICCSYGNGGYSVKVNDVEVATGGQFGSEEKKTFDVAAPPTPSPISQTPEPSSTVSTIKTFAPTTTGSVAETFAPTTTGSVAETFAPTTTGSTIN